MLGRLIYGIGLALLLPVMRPAAAAAQDVAPPQAVNVVTPAEEPDPEVDLSDDAIARGLEMGRPDCRGVGPNVLLSKGVAPDPFAPPVRAPILLRLNPELGEVAPAIRENLAAIGTAAIGEPAQFELTVLADYPKTLALVDLTKRKREWYSIGHPTPEGCGVLAPPQSWLGNLELDDWRDDLRARLAEELRVRTLIAEARRRRGGEIETCIAASVVEIAFCDAGPYVNPEGPINYWRDFKQDATIDIWLRNTGEQPRHVYLVTIDGANRIAVRNTGRGGSDQPLEPGVRRRILLSGIRPLGRLRMLTISSETPIALDALRQPGAFGAKPFRQGCGDETRPRNPVAPVEPLPDMTGWSFGEAELRLTERSCVRAGGGRIAALSQAPWIAQIYSVIPYTQAEIEADNAKLKMQRIGLAEMTTQQQDHRCGGALIAENIVLTAAHCFADPPFAGANERKGRENRKVRVGSANLGGGYAQDIDAIAIHAGYRALSDADDIALLKIRPRPGSRPYQGPYAPRTDARSLPASTPLSIFGWGYTEQIAWRAANFHVNSAGGFQKAARLLQVAPMEAMDRNGCRAALGASVTDRIICARTARGKAAFTCKGDSGGPLTQLVGGVYKVVGVVNFSRGCSPQVPTGFASVASYARWIEAAKAWLAVNPGRVGRVGEPASGR